MLKQLNSERVSLLLGIHPSCRFVHKYVEAVFREPSLLSAGEPFPPLRCSLRRLQKRYTHRGLFYQMSALLFNIQTDISVAERNFSREDISLVPLDIPLPPSVFIFLVKQIQWHMNKKRVTLLGIWELSGKWAMESLSDGMFPIFFVL